MAEHTTLARPYAKAAFDYARNNSQLKSWSEFLSTLSAVATEAKVSSFLASPASPSQKAQLIKDLCGDAIDKHMQAFVDLLSVNKRLSLLGVIRFLFEQFKSKQEKFLRVDLVSAMALSPEIEKELCDKLSKTLASEVTINVQVDTSLIAGALIRFGDTVIDGSVKGRLAKLSEALGLSN